MNTESDQEPSKPPYPQIHSRITIMEKQCLDTEMRKKTGSQLAREFDSGVSHLPDGDDRAAAFVRWHLGHKGFNPDEIEERVRDFGERRAEV